MNPVVAAWRYPSGEYTSHPGVEVYEAVRADGSVWRWRSAFTSFVDLEEVPASGWVLVAPPLTEIENAKEV